MKTYQDLRNAGAGDKDRANFALSAVQTFQSEPLYKIAVDADAYYRHQNPTIMRAQKMVYNLLGQATPNLYRPNHKVPCRYFYYFITQETMFLLGNGVIFDGLTDKDKVLGKNFDSAVQKAAVYALCGGVAFGFWNTDHLEAFPIYSADAPAFVPLWDEETGALRAGVRYWTMGQGKPFRMTLYAASIFPILLYTR